MQHHRNEYNPVPSSDIVGASHSQYDSRQDEHVPLAQYPHSSTIPSAPPAELQAISTTGPSPGYQGHTSDFSYVSSREQGNYGHYPGTSSAVTQQPGLQMHLPSEGGYASGSFSPNFQVSSPSGTTYTPQRPEFQGPPSSGATYGPPQPIGFQMPSPSGTGYPPPLPNSQMPSSLEPPFASSSNPAQPPPSYESVLMAGDASAQQSVPPIKAKDEDVIGEEDNSVCNCCKCFFSFIGHVGFIVCGALLLKEYLVPMGDETLVIVCSIFIAVFYFTALIESCCSDTCTYIHNFADENALRNYMIQMRDARPKICWAVSCYHYETKYRRVTTRDSRGNSHTRYESYQERVDTHKETRDFAFRRWRDTSSALPEIAKDQIVRIHFHKSFKFVDDAVEGMYKQQKEQFRSENEGRDTHMDFSEAFEMDDFEERMTASKDKKSRSCLMGPCCFWLSAFLLVTWCYRWCFRSATKKEDYTFVKEFID